MNRIILILALLMIAIMTNAQDSVKKRTYSAHYYERIAQFSQESPITSKDIVMLGNSLTENGGDWSIRVGKAHIVNRGIIGDEVMGVYDRLKPIVDGHPRKLFLMIGVNDISHGLSADSIAKMIDQVISRIRSCSPQTKVYLQSLLPFNESFHRYKLLDGKSGMVPEINAYLVKIARKHKVRFIDLYPYFTIRNTQVLRPELTTDGLHLNDEGYAIWVKHIKSFF